MYQRESPRTKTTRPAMLSCCLVDLAQPTLRDVGRMVRSLGIRIVEVPDVQSLDRPLDDLRAYGSSFVMLVLDTIGTDQLAVLQQVRAMTTVPVFVVSRSSTPETRIAAFEAGADEHVPLSVGRDELAARINAKLRRSRFGLA